MVVPLTSLRGWPWRWSCHVTAVLIATDLMHEWLWSARAKMMAPEYLTCLCTFIAIQVGGRDGDQNEAALAWSILLPTRLLKRMPSLEERVMVLLLSGEQHRGGHGRGRGAGHRGLRLLLRQGAGRHAATGR